MIDLLIRILMKFKKPEKIQFKHGINFRSNAIIDSLNPQFVEIGDNFVTAPGVVITAHDASTLIHTRSYRVEKVIIKNNVFIGANSVILPGVEIGNNVIIGAGSVVTKDIPDNSVFAGNPAKFLCKTDEYLSKCKKRNVLYKVSDQFWNEYISGIKYGKQTIKRKGLQA